MNFRNNEFGNYSSNRNKNYLNNYSNNFLQSSFEQRNQSINNSSNYELRKIIKEELESQITPSYYTPDNHSTLSYGKNISWGLLLLHSNHSPSSH